MSTREMTLQITVLNESARYHEEHNNSVLASWMRESSAYYAHQNQSMNAILDSMPLGNYEDTNTSRRDSFRHDWNEYQNEYMDNWY